MAVEKFIHLMDRIGFQPLVGDKAEFFRRNARSKAWLAGGSCSTHRCKYWPPKSHYMPRPGARQIHCCMKYVQDSSGVALIDSWPQQIRPEQSSCGEPLSGVCGLLITTDTLLKFLEWWHFNLHFKPTGTPQGRINQTPLVGPTNYQRRNRHPI